MSTDEGTTSNAGSSSMSSVTPPVALIDRSVIRGTLREILDEIPAFCALSAPRVPGNSSTNQGTITSSSSCLVSPRGGKFSWETSHWSRRQGSPFRVDLITYWSTYVSFKSAACIWLCPQCYCRSWDNASLVSPHRAPLLLIAIELVRPPALLIHLMSGGTT